MPEAATLAPTMRDEDWRYSDLDAVASIWPQAVENVSVAAGEHYARQIVIAPGVDDMAQQRNDAAFGEAHESRHRFDSMAVETRDVLVHQIDIDVRANARCMIHAVNGAARLVRLAINVTLAEGAHFEFGGVTIGGGEGTQEFVTKVVHAQPNATSNQVVRAVQWGNATGNFLGRIEVVKDAQKTDAAQNFRAILLNKGASANTKPELEIFADDVKCAHGAAIGELDPQIAFYMAARGLPPQAARKLQVHAFLADAFESVGDDDLREKLLGIALDQLEEGAL